jgi:subtilisin family serine protease
MKRLAALLIIPFLLMAGEGAFLDGPITPTTTYTYKEASVIHLPCGIDLDSGIAEPSLPANLTLTGTQEGIGTYLVQFDGPIYPEKKRALENTGARIDGYLPNYTYIVRMDQTTRTKLKTIPCIRWIGDYEPGYKISPEIDLDEQNPREFIVLLYAGSHAESIHPTLEELGGKIVEWSTNEEETILLVNLTPEKITSLVHEPEIKWIEPFNQPYLLNGNAQWVIQTWNSNNRRIWNKGLTGEGQVLASLDSGIRTTHNFFSDPSVPIDDFGDYPSHRKIIAYQQSVASIYVLFGDEDGHGTHTAGSILGNDRPVGGSSVNIGMAPDAKI